MELQLRVIEYLEDKGIMKKTLANLLGIYSSQFSHWLSGEYTLTDKQIKIIEDFLQGKY